MQNNFFETKTQKTNIVHRKKNFKDILDQKHTKNELKISYPPQPHH